MQPNQEFSCVLLQIQIPNFAFVQAGPGRPPRAAPKAKSVSVVQMTQRLHFVKLMLPEIPSNNDKHLD